MVTRPLLVVLAVVLVIVGSAMFFINAETFLNGHAVECEGSPMRSDNWCVNFRSGEIDSYGEVKKNEGRGELIGYSGAGVGILGIVLFVSHGITMRRRSR
ncbi:hypothetical protein ABZY19_35615 [Streptomyces sp. NPDC006475]|uniref:hypothetical protein n=1 Tax=Streptomyces sp. NPDC006475 TaxID=3155719 RepID=UPI0033A71148